MPASSASVLRGLAVAAAATLLAAAVALVGLTRHASPAARPAVAASGPTAPGAGTPDGADGPPGSATPLSPMAPGGSGAAGRPSSPGTVPPARPPVTSAPPLAKAGGAVGDPGQPTATAPGTYTYDLSSDGGQDSGSTSFTQKVTTEATSGGTTRQSVVDNRNGGSGNVDQEVEWSSAGEVQRHTTFDAGGQSGRCDWNPPIQELASGLAAGKAWDIRATCHFLLFGQPITVDLAGRAAVTGRERLQVGADAVDVWVITDTTDATVTTTTAGTYRIHHVATDRVSGRLGLLVEEDSTDTASSGSGTRTARSHQALRSIHPV